MSREGNNDFFTIGGTICGNCILEIFSSSNIMKTTEIHKRTFKRFLSISRTVYCQKWFIFIEVMSLNGLNRKKLIEAGNFL